jgi:hypothetical protein
MESPGNASTGAAPATTAATAFLRDALAGQERLRAPAGAALRVETDGESAEAAKVVSKEGNLVHMSAFTK